MENNNENIDRIALVKTNNAPEYMNSPPELMTVVRAIDLRQNGYAMIQGHPCKITCVKVSIT